MTRDKNLMDKIELAFEMLSGIIDGDETDIQPKMKFIEDALSDAVIEIENTYDEAEKLENELLELKFENGKKW